jgi:hypothetical protein
LTLPDGDLAESHPDDTAHTGVLRLFVDSVRTDSIFGRFEGKPLRRGTFFPSMYPQPDWTLVGRNIGDSIEVTLSPHIIDGLMKLYGRRSANVIRGNWNIPGSERPPYPFVMIQNR